MYIGFDVFLVDSNSVCNISRQLWASIAVLLMACRNVKI